MKIEMTHFNSLSASHSFIPDLLSPVPSYKLASDMARSSVSIGDILSFRLLNFSSNNGIGTVVSLLVLLERFSNRRCVAS